MSKKTIALPIFDIVVHFDSESKSGVIVSNLHDKTAVDVNDKEFSACMDGIESLILALACAGVDIESPEVIQAIETSVQSAEF